MTTKTQFTSPDGKRRASIAAHPVKNSYCVFFTFPSGKVGVKAPFPSLRSAAKWARGYVNDPANA